jgi:acetyl esterase
LQQKGGPPINTLSPYDARTVLSRLQASVPVKQLPANNENRTIPGGHVGKDVSITIVRPPESINETLPVIMFFHGGGWILGGFDTHERLVRELANNVLLASLTILPLQKPNILYLWNRRMLPQNGLLKTAKQYT